MNTQASLPARVEVYLPLVRIMANKLWHIHRQPAGLDYEDFFAEGVVGLLEARQHFDASRGFCFSTFASYRIRGALLDILRKAWSVANKEYSLTETENLPAPGVAEEVICYGQRLPNLILSLSEIQQRLVLGQLSGQSFASLAQELGLSKASAFRQYQAALRTCQDRLITQQRRMSS